MPVLDDDLRKILNNYSPQVKINVHNKRVYQRLYTYKDLDTYKTENLVNWVIKIVIDVVIARDIKDAKKNIPGIDEEKLSQLFSEKKINLQREFEKHKTDLTKILLIFSGKLKKYNSAPIFFASIELMQRILKFLATCGENPNTNCVNPLELMKDPRQLFFLSAALAFKLSIEGLSAADFIDNPIFGGRDKYVVLETWILNGINMSVMVSPEQVALLIANYKNFTHDKMEKYKLSILFLKTADGMSDVTFRNNNFVAEEILKELTKIKEEFNNISVLSQYSFQDSEESSSESDNSITSESDDFDFTTSESDDFDFTTSESDAIESDLCTDELLSQSHVEMFDLVSPRVSSNKISSDSESDPEEMPILPAIYPPVNEIISPLQEKKISPDTVCRLVDQAFSGWHKRSRQEDNSAENCSPLNKRARIGLFDKAQKTETVSSLSTSKSYSSTKR